MTIELVRSESRVLELLRASGEKGMTMRAVAKACEWPDKPNGNIATRASYVMKALAKMGLVSHLVDGQSKIWMCTTRGMNLQYVTTSLRVSQKFIDASREKGRKSQEAARIRRLHQIPKAPLMPKPLWEDTPIVKRLVSAGSWKPHTGLRTSVFDV